MLQIRRQGGFTILETSILLVILIFLGGILIPSYFHLVQQAREVRTRGTLVRIVQGQENFQLTNPDTGRYAGDFEELEAEGCVPQGDNCQPAQLVTTPSGVRRMASSRIRDGYHLDLEADLDSSDDAMWCVTASPIKRSSKRRWFYADQTGVIRCDIGLADHESPACR